MQSADEVFIVTGPLYVPKPAPGGKGYVLAHPMIGEPPRMVAVPTHFFKVVLAEQNTMLGQQARGLTHSTFELQCSCTHDDQAFAVSFGCAQELQP